MNIIESTKIEKEFFKVYPKDSKKGLVGVSYTKGYFKIHIPKNKTFLRGYTWHGYASGYVDAKRRALQHLLKSN